MLPVRILLSTYNGARFLEPLLESVLGQDYPYVHVVIRDDGSTDSTLGVLSRYSAVPNVTILAESNVGVVQSFYRLLRMRPRGSQYFAFCDQDDVWDKDKISRAVSVLENSGTYSQAMLYCSRARIVTEDLQLIGHTTIPQKPLTFQNALVQNVAIGCTTVLNGSARQVLLYRPIPTDVVMHDWWAYILVSAFGRVLFDPEAKVMYRQHLHNVIGAQHGWISSWLARVRRFRKNYQSLVVRRQAKALMIHYGDLLPTPERRTLREFLNQRRWFTERLRYALTTDLYRQSRIDDVIMRALLALGQL